MRIKQSLIINGPQVSDTLAGFIQGLDLSGTGIDGGSPGDTVFFDLYLSMEATETEKQIYDYIQGLKIYIEKSSSYSGDTSAEEDLADILELGDLGYGLSLKNPQTNNYDLIFDSSNFNSENNALLIPKEMMLNFDTTDNLNPTLISIEGFNTGSVNSSSNGYSLVSNENLFNERMVNLKVYNITDNTFAIIDSYVSPTNVILKTSIGNTWDGDSIMMKRLLEPIDGVLATNDLFAQVVGNYVKLEMKYSLPSSYRRNGIKQFKLKCISGYE